MVKIKSDNLEHWMIKGGADHTKLEIAYYSDSSRGANAK